MKTLDMVRDGVGITGLESELSDLGRNLTRQMETLLRYSLVKLASAAQESSFVFDDLDSGWAETTKAKFLHKTDIF